MLVLPKPPLNEPSNRASLTAVNENQPNIFGYAASLAVLREPQRGVARYDRKRELLHPDIPPPVFHVRSWASQLFIEFPFPIHVD